MGRRLSSIDESATSGLCVTVRRIDSRSDNSRSIVSASKRSVRYSTNPVIPLAASEQLHGQVELRQLVGDLEEGEADAWNQGRLNLVRPWTRKLTWNSGIRARSDAGWMAVTSGPNGRSRCA